MTDLIAGQCSFSFPAFPRAHPVKAGRSKYWRSAAANAHPRCPTCRRSRKRRHGYEYTTCTAFSAPAHAAAHRNAAQRMCAQGAGRVGRAPAADEPGRRTAPSSPEELTRYMREESARWAKLIKASNIRIE